MRSFLGSIKKLSHSFLNIISTHSHLKAFLKIWNKIIESKNIFFFLAFLKVTITLSHSFLSTVKKHSHSFLSFVYIHSQAWLSTTCTRINLLLKIHKKENQRHICHLSHDHKNILTLPSRYNIYPFSCLSPISYLIGVSIPSTYI